MNLSYKNLIQTTVSVVFTRRSVHSVIKIDNVIFLNIFKEVPHALRHIPHEGREFFFCILLHFILLEIYGLYNSF